MTKSTQMALPLSYPAPYYREDFLMADCYEEVFRWLNLYPNWYHHMFLILGPTGCGKTHIAKMFTQHIYRAKDLTFDDIIYMPDLCTVEDIDGVGVNETLLFHLYNYTAEKNRKVLMTARAMPLWKLPDLKSRMNIVPTAKIAVPDDKMIMMLILKELSERQLDIESGVIEYILKHIERSFPAIQDFINHISLLSLAQKRKITIPLAKEALSLLRQENLINAI